MERWLEDFRNNFTDCEYGEDFENVWWWPKGWPNDIKYPDGSVYLNDPQIWFKAYDTSLCETSEDSELFEQGYLFNCMVRTMYDRTVFYCEDVLAEFPARDREEAERLLTVAAAALYEDGWEE